MKAGTSSLFQELSRSRQIQPALDKEPDILLRCDSLEAAADAYRTQFPASTADVGRLRTEASTAYSKGRSAATAAQRAASWLDARFVYVLRDPVERLLSEFRFDCARGRLAGDLDAALRSDDKYVQNSDYVARLQDWQALADTGRLGLLAFENYRDQHERTARALSAFLGIDEDWIGEEPAHANPTSQAHALAGVAGTLSRSTLYRSHVRPRLPADVRRRMLSLVARASGRSPLSEVEELVVPDWVHEALAPARSVHQQVLDTHTVVDVCDLGPVP